MANLGNTIVNGALRVNGKINSSDVISAPSFVGAGETLTGHLYLNGITSNTTASTTKIIFGNPTTQYAVIRANDSKTLVFANSLTDNSLAIEYIPSQTAFRPVTSASLDLGSNNNKWKNVYANTFVGALSGNASSATKLATARTINGVSFDGSANITVADSTKLPLAGGTLTGKVKLYNSDASTGLQSGQLTIGSTNSAYNGSTGGGDVAIELWRGTNASWQILNNGGYLYFKNNYTTAIQSSYSQVALKMNYNTGDATFYGNISPDANNTGTLGTSSMKWNNVYATTFTGALSGNATSAGTTAVTDTNPTSGTWYYPTWVSGTSGNLGHRVNNGFSYYTLQGTTSAVGRSLLQLGNSTASGTAGNKYGTIRIHNQSSGYTDIVTTTSTSNFTITLPAASGTVSLTSHTHSAATTSANGFMSSADKTKLNALHYVRSGTAVPDSSLGENGDIYILLES